MQCSIANNDSVYIPRWAILPDLDLNFFQNNTLSYQQQIQDFFRRRLESLIRGANPVYYFKFHEIEKKLIPVGLRSSVQYTFRWVQSIKHSHLMLHTASPPKDICHLHTLSKIPKILTIFIIVVHENFFILDPNHDQKQNLTDNHTKLFGDLSEFCELLTRCFSKVSVFLQCLVDLIIRMGQQHYSHVHNDTTEQIKVTLTDKDNRHSSQIISPSEHVCFPTPHGRVTLSVFRQLGSSQFSQNPEAIYTDDSDRSFIVKRVGDSLNIVRTVYGTIRQQDTRMRSTSRCCFTWLPSKPCNSDLSHPKLSHH